MFHERNLISMSVHDRFINQVSCARFVYHQSSMTILKLHSHINIHEFMKLITAFQANKSNAMATEVHSGDYKFMSQA